MDIGKVITTTFGEVCAAVLSLGPSQVYGVVKGAVTLVEIAYTKIRIASAERTLDRAIKAERLLKKTAELELFNKTHGDEAPVVHGTETYLQVKLAKLYVRLKQQFDSLTQAGKAMVPLAGVHLALTHSGKSVGLAGAISQIIEDTFPKSIRRCFFPGADVIREIPIRHTSVHALVMDGYAVIKKPNGQSVVDLPKSWEAMGAKQLYIPVRKGEKGTRKIEALYVPGYGCSPSDKTVVLYHPNAATAYDMFTLALSYSQMGFNVLAPTMGGHQYEQRDAPKDAHNNFSTSERSMYADVDGQMAYLQTLGVKEVGVHGVSIGGANAFQAAYKYGKPKRADFPRVKFVVADKTFTSGRDAASSLANNAVGAKTIGQAIGNASFTRDGYDPYNENELDGMDNERKARALFEGDVGLISIAATEDTFMNKDFSDKHYAENFAFDLAQARYGKSERTSHTILIDGSHNVPTTMFPEAMSVIFSFVNSRCSQ